ncbi:nucleotidyltransferase family protein, partial [bacterium]|nr:nucleotidyltransferase family protein [bacterium]
MGKNLFEDALKSIVSFFEKQKIPYFILGGLAVGVFGEARFTYDIDLTILLKEDDYGAVIKRLKAAKFSFDPKEAILSIIKFGSFRIFYKKVQIDIIIASTSLEEEAVRRKKKVSFMGQSTCFLTAEDLVLFKVIAGRPKDVLDAESIAIRQKKKLDKKYLR